MIVLGIETSCDETGVGIVRSDGRTTELLANEVASSVDEHARFGGVVPEVASRAHLSAMVPAVHRAMATAGVTARDVDAVAVTAGPGLSGALLVGLAAAKAYATAWDVPLYGVNHLAAHVAVDTLQNGPLPPCLALLVSGGHSSLLDVPDIAGPVTPLGATIDDAAGEAFDKVARLLGLPFPGGPHIDRVAREGDPRAVAFPRGLTGPRDAPFDFSFSGLKTAVARHVEALERAGTRGAGGRRRRELPGGRGRRAHREGRARRPRARDGRAAARGRGGGQLAAAGAGRGAVQRRRAHPARAAAGPVHGQRGDGRRAGRAPRRGWREAQPAGPARRLVPPGHAGAGGLTRARARCARTRAFTPHVSGAHQRRRPPGSR